MALTKDQILQAADQLAAAGETPTLAAVRKSIGGGSYTTINEALKEWKAKQQATVTPIREPAPEGISKRLDEVGAEVWAIALELANARLTSEREALKATRQQLETAQQETTELADQLSAELETLQAQHQQTTKALQTATTSLEQAKQENAALSRQLATTEARTEETTKRADDLKAELQHAHTENAAQRQRHTNEAQALQAQLNTTEKALQSEVANGVGLTLALTHAQTQAQAAQQQQQALQKRLGDEIRVMGERLAAAQTEREQAMQAASATREDAAWMRGELEALRVQNTALLNTLKPVPAAPTIAHRV
jgi:colicin import membrane protein